MKTNKTLGWVLVQKPVFSLPAWVEIVPLHAPYMCASADLYIINAFAPEESYPHNLGRSFVLGGEGRRL